jgi:hypothetical protein
MFDRHLINFVSIIINHTYSMFDRQLYKLVVIIVAYSILVINVYHTYLILQL